MRAKDSKGSPPMIETVEKATTRNGAEALLATAHANGVEVCFSNPGTTEMHLVAALDTVAGVRGVLALFEGVVAGAADGYGRMTGKPALTLFHLGPGFANGIANLHNARRAQTPIVNIIGHHATWQRNCDPPLNSDVELLAMPVSAWQRTNATARELSRDVAAAISAALGHPGQISTLIVPADSQWDAVTAGTVEQGPPPRAHCVEPSRVDTVAALLRERRATVLLLGAHALRSEGLHAAGRVASACGCRLVAETFPARMERRPELPCPERLPYFPELVADFFEGTERVVLAGALEPVAFFGYQDGRSRLLPAGVELVTLAGRDENAPMALLDLADALEAPARLPLREVVRPPSPTGALSSTAIAQAIVARLPEDAIVVDEGITSIGAWYPVSRQAPPHTYLTLPGGAIGFGMPCGVGAAIACPERKVLVLEGDGSGLYTVQALWSQAREGLDVVNLVFVNDVYQILQVELGRAGVTEPGPQSLALTQLGRPSVDWCGLARSFGVPAQSVRTADELDAALARAFAEPGPHLIAVCLC
jgi:acetolactate synthase-1/2/3 large subunit